MNEQERADLAQRVREACVTAAIDGYENAAMAGLCGEGALEAAISAIRRLDIAVVLAQSPPGDNPEGKAPQS